MAGLLRSGFLERRGWGRWVAGSSLFSAVHHKLPRPLEPPSAHFPSFPFQVYFGLPTPAQRLAILRVHTQRWAWPPPDSLLQQVRALGDWWCGKGCGRL